MILFSDNEPAMKALKQAVVEAMRDLELTLQESPTSAGHENAPSNGTAESAVREVKRMIRAILSELESKLGQAGCRSPYAILGSEALSISPDEV